MQKNFGEENEYSLKTSGFKKADQQKKQVNQILENHTTLFFSPSNSEGQKQISHFFSGYNLCSKSNCTYKVKHLKKLAEIYNEDIRQSYELKIDFPNFKNRKQLHHCELSIIATVERKN